MEIKYEWRELTEDGLLKKPRKLGPYYNEDDVNQYGGFDSEEDALTSYAKFAKDHEYGVPYELVLVKFYRAERGA